MPSCALGLDVFFVFTVNKQPNAFLRAGTRLALTQNGVAVESALHVGLD